MFGEILAAISLGGLLVALVLLLRSVSHRLGVSTVVLLAAIVLFLQGLN